MTTRLFLIGMSGAGKSTVGARVADLLGWRFVDMDDAIEQAAGMSVPELFTSQGEPAFRKLEHDLLLGLLNETNIVVSTGGGAPCNDAARDAISNTPGTLSVWMHASAEELYRRITAHQDSQRTTARPMLSGEDPLQRMRSLLDSRTGYYAAADVTIPVENRDVELIASDIAELVNLSNGIASEVSLDTGFVQSRIQVGPGIANTMPQVIAAKWPKAQAVWVGLDANVETAQSAWIDAMRSQIGVPVHVHRIASGERSKSLETYGELLNWMLTNGAQRGDVVVAFGGGVVGDLMGFVAATVLRGVALIQVPTSLLSMVDSSVGGKTGINHATGKNLIGAFYQPPVVLVDSQFLGTVPQRELYSGFGEIIKHGVIQASTPGGEPRFLTDVLHLNTSGLKQLRDPLVSWVLRQNITLKARVVAEDEREADLRQILNFGHTIGHGIEAAGFELLHGEAISVGMVAASNIAVQKGLASQAWLESLVTLLQAYDLPISARAEKGEVQAKMQSDKKKSAGKQNWVLPLESGGVTISSDVSRAEIEAAIDAVLGNT